MRGTQTYVGSNTVGVDFKKKNAKVKTVCVEVGMPGGGGYDQGQIRRQSHGGGRLLSKRQKGGGLIVGGTKRRQEKRTPMEGVGYDA